MFNGRATDRLRDGPRVIFEAIIVATALRTIETAVAVTEETGYVGSWHLGLVVNNIHGVPGFKASWDVGNSGQAFSDEQYRRTTTVTHEQLADVRAPLSQLVGRLLRTLDSPYSIDEVLGSDV